MNRVGVAVTWTAVLGLLGAWATPASAQTGVSRAPSGQATPARAKSRTATASTASFDRVAKQATEAREAGRVAEAIALYEQATRLRPAWEEGRWYLGTLHYGLEHYVEARESFRRVLVAQQHAQESGKRIAPGRVYAMKGLCEFKLKSYDTALADFLRARELRVDSEELQAAVGYHAAVLLTRFEQYDQALLTLQAIAQTGNDSPSVIEAFGIASLRMPLLPGELPPERRDVVLLAGRSAFYQAARQPGRARAAFDELIARYPDYPAVQYAYGVFLLADEPDRAIEAFKRELKGSPGHVPSLLQIAFAYIKRSDWEAARPWAEQAVALAPTDFAGRRALGQVLLGLGDTAAAIDHLERGVKLAPDSPSLRFTLARAYQSAGRSEDAQRERDAFTRLQRLNQSQQFGEQAVGGIVDTLTPPKVDRKP